MNWTIVANVTRNGAWKGEFFVENLEKSARGTRNGPLISYLGRRDSWTLIIVVNL